MMYFLDKQDNVDWNWSVFLQLDCGGHRCGLDYKDSKTIDFALNIIESSSSILKGIYTHAGHSYKQENNEGLQSVVRSEGECVEYFAEKLYDRIDSEKQEEFSQNLILSIGSTPSLSYKGESSCSSNRFKVNEYHPGNYIFYDQMQCEIGSCEIRNCCAFVVASVVSILIDGKK